MASWKTVRFQLPVSRIEFHGTRIEIMAIPSMWGEYSGLIPENVIAISDKLLTYALPKADALIHSKLH